MRWHTTNLESNSENSIQCFESLQSRFCIVSLYGYLTTQNWKISSDFFLWILPYIQHVVSGDINSKKKKYSTFSRYIFRFFVAVDIIRCWLLFFVIRFMYLYAYELSTVIISIEVVAVVLFPFLSFQVSFFLRWQLFRFTNVWNLFMINQTIVWFSLYQTTSSYEHLQFEF